MNRHPIHPGPSPAPSSSRPARLPTLATLVLSLLGGCGAGGSDDGTPISGRGLPAEIVFCRARADNPHNATEIRTATWRGLDPKRVLERSGVESGVRVHPDGVRLCYARERQIRDADSREIFVASLDGSTPETRLTVDGFPDDRPCWSPDGTRILFSSGRLGNGRRLWLMSAGGEDPAAFHDDGTEQLGADWARAAPDRIVFTRIDRSEPAPRAKLWLIDADGRLPVQLTDGGPGVGQDPVPGDYEPAFAPDGASVVFSRVLQDGVSMLMRADVGSGAVTPISSPDGEDRCPRFTPDGGRILFARSRPADGMPGLRLWTAAADGTGALLIFPDERFAYLGFDPLPALGPEPGGPSETLDVPLDDAVLEVIAGGRTIGSQQSILARDGNVLGLATQVFGNHDVAGINARVDLPADIPADVLELHIEVTMALGKVDPAATARLSLFNPVENRNDTVVESQPGDEDLHTYRFSTLSLAHISRERQIELKVIGEFEAGAATELFIDEIAVAIRRRTTAK